MERISVQATPRQLVELQFERIENSERSLLKKEKYWYEQKEACDRELRKIQDAREVISVMCELRREISCAATIFKSEDIQGFIVSLATIGQFFKESVDKVRESL